MASEAARLPLLVPRSSKSTPPDIPPDTARRKSASKSRNGMFVFVSQTSAYLVVLGRKKSVVGHKVSVKVRARMMYLGKPQLQRVTCGGYKKDIRFRSVAGAPTPQLTPLPTAPAAESREAPSTESNTRLCEGISGENDPSHISGEPSSVLSFWPWLEEDVSNIPLPDFDLSTLPWMDFSHLDFPSATEGSNNLDPLTEEGETHSKPGMNDSLESVPNVNNDTFLGSASASPDASAFPFFQSIELEADDMEEVETLFHEETLYLLSIWEDTSRSPWRTMIWPMTKESKALYHAIAAMTYLQHSKYTPSRREKGLVHARKSTQQLAADLSSGEIQIEAALAATIALGFAESWDFQKSSTGRTHIQGAKILLQQACAQYKAMHSSNQVSARLSFLANTWIYMDVLARLTSDCGPSLDPELLQFFTETGPPAVREELDPLMGYAASLFPIIGRLADLIAQIRARCTRRNSPVIIAKGIEIRHAIEDWSPAIDLEQIDGPTNNMVECIQTAEAYRWSTLLLLQEAVPELPSLTSYKELGQKTLVYLATIPSNSATINVHIYPLMVAAIQAVEEEDREFVRDRWNIMRKRMVNGIIDRCADIMEEVWRRRDAHFAEWLARNSPDPSPFGFSPPHGGGIAGVNGNPQKASSSGIGMERENARSPSRKSSAHHSDFPISIAFKKGVDPITRSGNVDYTVKGNLHWITVMKERGWEVLLG